MSKMFVMVFSVETLLMFALDMAIAKLQIIANATMAGRTKIVRTQCVMANIPTLLLFVQDMENAQASTLANVIMATYMQIVQSADALELRRMIFQFVQATDHVPKLTNAHARQDTLLKNANSLCALESLQMILQSAQVPSIFRFFDIFFGPNPLIFSRSRILRISQHMPLSRRIHWGKMPILSL